ncbi:type II secretion system ATPase GspE [Permianibacter aggregans]|uniref:Type II secretion system protein E n=1 Tax=Permianibacter aggregans TaxID=1510150 RepID=A0A4R6UQZ8_9GAMM|nr:type II secretion system ATPase GspE [Permianibacter aggregans]QGX39570.1 type II secretion system protein GspE [Permianibacter aggregans]TDQ49680.1 type II secretion system protein E (GspE) [Permianibacter aggregans]
MSLARLPFGFARRHGVVIAGEQDGVAQVLVKPGVAPVALAEARRYVAQNAKFSVVSPEEFEGALARTYQTESGGAAQAMEDIGEDLDLFRLAEEMPQTEDLLDAEDDAPIIKLINALLSEAIKEHASDIHIETFEKNLIVRFRVDGVLREVLQPDRRIAPLLVSRIKVMAKLDIAEKRIPQDGRIALKLGGRAVDVRVSTLPSSHGERVVLRLLDKQAGRLDFSHLGMRQKLQDQLSDLLHKPHGILLVTGPTGSGKTTTLYAGLTLLNNAVRNILTVEDPVEYLLDGIGQTQVNTKVDMTFARGLRAILRQDPDVVMVGEIRDLETAQIAVQASLTGHLVLSTLHTNSAVGAVTRLADMGVEPFLLSSSLLGVLAQRLVRRLCDDCKRAETANEKECELMGLDKANPPIIYHPVGCQQCRYGGYRGRQGIFELLLVDESMRTMIHNNASEQEIEKHARKYSPSIRDDGRAQVLAGVTSVEEVLRVTRED